MSDGIYNIKMHLGSPRDAADAQRRSSDNTQRRSSGSPRNEDDGQCGGSGQCASPMSPSMADSQAPRHEDFEDERRHSTMSTFSDVYARPSHAIHPDNFPNLKHVTGCENATAGEGQKTLCACHVYRLAEQFVRDGRVGRSLRMELSLQRSLMHKIADSDSLKGIVMSLGFLGMIVPLARLDAEPQIALSVAIALLLCTMLKTYVLGRMPLHGKFWHKFEVFLTLAHLVMVITAYSLSDSRTTILYKLLIPFIITSWSRTLRHSFAIMWDCVMSTLVTLTGILIVLMIIGYFGTVMFHGTFKYDLTQEPLNDRYDDLGSGFIATFVLFSTENYPSVAVQPWQNNNWSLMYFMIVVMIGQLIEAFILGAVSEAFDVAMENSVRYHYAKELRGYSFAFLALTTIERTEDPKWELRASNVYNSPDGEEAVDVPEAVESTEALKISFQVWENLVKCFYRDEQKALQMANVTAEFADSDGNNEITLDEFFVLAELLKYQIVEVSEKKAGRTRRLFSLAKRNEKKLQQAGSVWLRKVVMGPIFINLSQLLILFTFFLLLTVAGQGHDHDWLQTTLSVIIALFGTEVLLRIASFGYAYFNSGYNILDMVILCIVLISCAALQEVSERSACAMVARFAVLFRLDMWKPAGGTGKTILNFFDVFLQEISKRKVMDQWDEETKSHKIVPLIQLHEKILGMNDQVGKTFSRTFALFAFIGGMMLFVWYVFSVIGEAVIGDSLGAIDALPGSPMNGGYGDMTNFSTLGVSMVSMFQVIVGNNWNDILYTAMAAKGKGMAVFFIVYYILVQLVLMNIFIAIVVDRVHRTCEDEGSPVGQHSTDDDDGADARRKYRLIGNEGKRIPVWSNGKQYVLEPKRKSLGQGLHKDVVEGSGYDLLQKCIQSGIYRIALYRTEGEAEAVEKKNKPKGNKFRMDKDPTDQVQGFWFNMSEGLSSIISGSKRSSTASSDAGITRTVGSHFQMNASQAVKQLVSQIKFFPPHLSEERFPEDITPEDADDRDSGETQLTSFGRHSDSSEPEDPGELRLSRNSDNANQVKLPTGNHGENNHSTTPAKTDEKVAAVLTF